jgi:hypothetical protein
VGEVVVCGGCTSGPCDSSIRCTWDARRVLRVALPWGLLCLHLWLISSPACWAAPAALCVAVVRLCL